MINLQLIVRKATNIFLVEISNLSSNELLLSIIFENKKNKNKKSSNN